MRFEKDNIIVSTVEINDTPGFTYETAIAHPSYNNGEFVIVQLYKTEEETIIGHENWVTKMMQKKLPEVLIEVGECQITKMEDSACGGKEWRIKRKFMNN